VGREGAKHTTLVFRFCISRIGLRFYESGEIYASDVGQGDGVDCGIGGENVVCVMSVFSSHVHKGKLVVCEI
jgi:hypothetical protein